MALTAQYNPFSFQEMLQAVSIADEQHKAIEQEYANIDSKARMWESLANNQKDIAAYNQYKAYANDLEQQAGVLAANGLNPRSRQAFNQMRSRYSSEIQPIEIAYTQRQKMIDEQREARAKDGNTRFSVNAEDVGLMDLIKNPSMTYSGFTGTQLEKMAANVASTFQNELRDPQGKWAGTLRGIFGPQYFEKIVKHGLSMQDVMNTIANDPRGNEILQYMRSNVLASSGIQEWGNDEITQWAINNIDRGLFQAVGPEKIDRVANQDYDYYQRLALQRSSKKQQEQQDRVPYKIGERVNVNADVKTSELNKFKEFLNNNRDLITNPNSNFLKEKSPYGIGSSYAPSITGAYIQGGSGDGVNINKKQLDNISKEVGFDIKSQEDIDKATAFLDAKIASSAQLVKSYSMNLTDNQYLNASLRDANVRLGDKTYREIKDNGKIGKEVPFIPDNTTNIFYEPGTGLVASKIDKEGKISRVLIHPEALDNIVNTGNGPKISEMMTDMDDYISMGDGDTAAFIADHIMRTLDQEFFREKVGGTSDSDLNADNVNPWSAYNY